MNAWALILGGAVVLVVVVVVARMLAARGAAVRPRGAPAFLASGQSQLDPTTPRGYSPKNVGNDASARPCGCSLFTRTWRKMLKAKRLT